MEWLLWDEDDYRHQVEGRGHPGDPHSEWRTRCGLQIADMLVSWSGESPPDAGERCPGCSPPSVRHLAPTPEAAAQVLEDDALVRVRSALADYHQAVERMRTAMQLTPGDPPERVASMAKKFVATGHVPLAKKPASRKRAQLPAPAPRTRRTARKATSKPRIPRIRIVSGGLPGLGKRR